MSWSLSTDAHKAEDIRDALDHTQAPQHLSEVQLAQVRAAKEAAHTLLNNGAIGPVNNVEASEDYFRVRISGHGTDGHDVGDQVSAVVEKVAPPE